MNRAKTTVPVNRRTKGDPEDASGGVPISATRETVESIVIAVILAFLFRAFIAEAFVIPTGSMAPTLMGRNRDVVCAQCGFAYRAGASIEEESGAGQPVRRVVASVCPICRYRMELDPAKDPNQGSFSGDRILVSKFTYDFSDPHRWDIIVFKFPGNAKQNYIKRLVGLPNEHILIHDGDVYIQPPDGGAFQIARKPDYKLKAMLQTVDDTQYIADDLTRAGWPLRWQAWSPDGSGAAGFWTTPDNGHSYVTAAPGNREVWLRYHHIVPSDEGDWEAIEDAVQNGTKMADTAQLTGELITDFYAYNAITTETAFRVEQSPRYGMHWVGDLAVEAAINVDGSQGDVILDLVEAGHHYTCRFDVAAGTARLSIDGGSLPFSDAGGHSVSAPTASQALSGPGKYELRMSNLDDEIRVWVNDRRLEFDGPTTYVPETDRRPRWSPQDPGDAAPVGIGSRGVAMTVRRLKVFRDVYYIACKGSRGPIPLDYDGFFTAEEVRRTLTDPTTWANARLFSSRRQVEFTLGADEFFPMGDNSPHSSDARVWDTPHVDRDMLTGKALMIYWPHAWKRPIPFWPDFSRMGFIR